MNKFKDLEPTMTRNEGYEPFLSFDLNKRLQDCELWPVGERELSWMMRDGNIGMDGFRYYTKEEAQANRRIFLASQRPQD